MRKSGQTVISATIGGVPWTISFTPTWRDVNIGTDDNNRNDGLTIFTEYAIRVAGDLPPAAQRRTLMHELIHAVVESYKIRELTEQDGHAEVPIDQLATGLCEALESIGIHLPSKTK